MNQFLHGVVRKISANWFLHLWHRFRYPNIKRQVALCRTGLGQLVSSFIDQKVGP